MIFTPSRARGAVVGVGLLVLLAALEAGVLLALRQRPVGPGSALLGLFGLALVPVIARVGLWLWSLLRLRYEVTREGIVIHAATARHVVPMADIRGVRRGVPPVESWRGAAWPGLRIGHGHLRADGVEGSDILVFATSPPAEQLLILGGGALAYAISPTDPEAFMAELRLRRRLGPVHDLAETTVRPAFFALPVWSDGVILALLAASLIINALLFAWTAWRYPTLPAEFALRFRHVASVGPVPGAVVPRGTLWRLPAMGLAAVAVDQVLAVAVHRRARLAAVLLAVGAVLVQGVVTIALVRAG